MKKKKQHAAETWKDNEAIVVNGKVDENMPGQIKRFPGTTKQPSVKIEERDLSRREDCESLLKLNGAFLASLPLRFRRNKEMILMAIEDDPYVITELDEKTRNDVSVKRAYEESIKKNKAVPYKKQKLTDDIRHIIQMMEEDKAIRPIDDSPRFVPAKPQNIMEENQKISEIEKNFSDIDF